MQRSRGPKILVGCNHGFEHAWLALRLFRSLEDPVLNSSAFRIGQGFDVHALAAGRDLILGGVRIEHSAGLLGHSDADVLLHALTDALLGAAGLGDIGRHFPDTDPTHRGADSRVLLRTAYQRVLEAGWEVVNIDATIHAQAPKMEPHVSAMIAHIAADLSLETTAINIKAKTNEGLGHLGRQEGIPANVITLLTQRSR